MKLKKFMSELVFLVVLLIITSVVNGILISNGEKRTITIAENGDDSETCLLNKSRPCKSLSYVLRSKELNNTLVNITQGLYQLNGTYIIERVTGLKIAGASSGTRPVVECEKNDASGLVFLKCKNVSLQNLEFQFCGSRIKTTSMAKNASVLSYAAVLMEDSKHVEWTNIQISNSTGIGGVFYDVTGMVDMKHVILEGNIGKIAPLLNTSSNLGNIYNTGGGIYIEFTPTPSTDTSAYTLTLCSFSNNFAQNLRSDVISDSIGPSYFSLGRGGAISFISRGSRSGNNLTIDSCHFTNNSALWGAGVFGEFDDKSGGNSIKVKNSSFSGNHAVFAGGAIRIGVNSDNQKGHNTIEVSETAFKQNTAALGGAFSEYQTVKARISTVLIYNCQFKENSAIAASSLHLQHLNATLIDVNITNSKLKGHEIHPVREEQGSLYCYSSYISMKGNNFVDRARATAFVLDFCDMILNGTAEFTRNFGTNGGAIAMYGHAKIRFKTGSKLILHYNKAKHRGGGIYIDTAVPLAEMFNSTQLNMYKCFFIFGNSDDEFKDADAFNATIDFLGNSASQRGGDNIWATTINWCRGKDELHYNNTALKWKIMKSNGTLLSTNRTVVTCPRFISTHGGEQWNAHPGIPIHPQITLYDENWNIVDGTVSIQITSYKKQAYLASSEYQFSVNGNTSLTIKGSSGSEYNITLRTLDRLPIVTTIKNGKLKKCPPGLYWKKDACVCQPISKGVIHCDVDTNHIYIIPSRWGNVKDNSEFAQHVCPMHYCKRRDNNGVGWLFNKEDQCTTGRDPQSALCSKCKKGFSVYLGSEKCEEYNSYAGLWWLLLIALVLTVMVFAILFVNFDTYSTYLNGFLYSYQIIPLLIVDEEYLDSFISLIMAITNVSGTGKMQFKGFLIWKGMNDMDKILLNYAAPTYLILCTFAFGALSSVCRRSPFNKRTTFRAFVFISVIAYADFTKLSFKILRPIELNGQCYVYLAAYMRCFSKEHLPYAIIALAIILVVVIGFPFALLFPTYVVRIPRLSRLMGIFDTFRQPFKQEPYIGNFAAFYFLNRLVLLTLYVALPTGPVLDVVFGIACLLILIIFVAYKPYVDWKMNFFDGLQLTNIVIMSIVSAGTSVAYDSDVRAAFNKTNWALAYVPLLCMLYRLLTWGKNEVQVWRERKSRRMYSETPDMPYLPYEDEGIERSVDEEIRRS